MNLSSLLTVQFIIEGQGGNPCVERVPVPGRFFLPKSHRFAFKLCTINGQKIHDSSRTSN